MDDSGKKNALKRVSSSDTDTDSASVRITQRAGFGRRAALLYKAIALTLVVCCAGYVLMTLTFHQTPSYAGNTSSDALASNATESSSAGPDESHTATTMPHREITPRRVERPPAQPDDLSQFIPSGEVPPMAEVIDRLHQAGVHTGIGAFQPPGTSPPLVGLAVPDDYALPDGYVRHSQATDDGQRIAPILMFSPDFEFFDASGRPITIPQNRVVPPELAPPGLPIHLIDIPPALRPGSP